MKQKTISIQKGQERQFQTIAREDFKRRMLNEILIDINICKLEGRNYKEFVLDLKNMIDGICEKNNF